MQLRHYISAPLRNGNASTLSTYFGPGWRSGVIFSAVAAAIVLIINVSFMLWATTGEQDSTDGSVVLSYGECEEMRRLSVGIHVLINILSTVLLGGSNYCMQCLTAPTRKDIDRKHHQGAWLDIGVPSVRNLRHIGWKRVLLWACLVLSSVPLHLFYNSAVFATTLNRAYVGLIVREDFLQPDANMTVDPDVSDPGGPFYPKDFPVERWHQRALAGAFQRLEKNDCIDAYATFFQYRYGDLLLVVGDNGTVPGPFITIKEGGRANPESPKCPMDPYSWICSGVEKTGGCARVCEEYLESIRNAPEWKLGFEVRTRTVPVEYCLSSPLPGTCKLEFSKHLAIIVIAFNIVKVVAMASILLFVREDPLNTLGDAIASFLEKPDPTTSGMCLLPKVDRLHHSGAWKFPAPNGALQSKPFVSKYRRWDSGTSSGRRFWFLFLYVTAIGLCIFFLVYGILKTPSTKPVGSLWSAGLGAIDERLIIIWDMPKTGTTSLIGSALIANIPQVILSLIYFACNALFTSMLVAVEWSKFGTSRKGLRRSTGHDRNHKNESTEHQRSTYFLQLPYRYAIPLMVFSALLHWLVSQSLFLISVEGYGYEYDESIDGYSAAPVYSEEDSWTTCGYSPLAITLVMGVSVILVAFTIFTGMKRLPSNIPVAGSCSAAISAACHGGPTAPTAPLRWGVTSPAGPGNVGHCAFSMDEVSEPVEGEKYAGLQEHK